MSDFKNNRMVTPGRTQPKRGFTLIELLVVIAIVALLISILLPALSAARDLATAMTFQSNLRQVSLGSFLLAADNDHRLPGFLEYRGGERDNHTMWQYRVAPYIGEKNPWASTPNTITHWERPDVIRQSMLHDPADETLFPRAAPRPPRPIRNVAQNGGWGSSNKDWLNEYPNGRGASYRRLSQIGSPSEIALLMPGNTGAINSEWAMGALMMPNAFTANSYEVFCRYPSKLLYCSFIDGHITGVDEKTIMQEVIRGHHSVFWDIEGKY